MRTWYASNSQSTVHKLIFQRIVIIKMVGLKKKRRQQARRDDTNVFETMQRLFVQRLADSECCNPKRMDPKGNSPNRDKE